MMYIASLFVFKFFYLLEDAFDFHCELDEYSELVKELRESGLVKDRKKGLKTYKNSFVGKEVVDWLVKAKSLGKLFFFA